MIAVTKQEHERILKYAEFCTSNAIIITIELAESQHSKITMRICDYMQSVDCGEIIVL